MPFQVKATIIQFLGDTEKYPCHMNYGIGDEIIFDGGQFTGNICPHILSVLARKIEAIGVAGPRYIDPEYYNLFWYSPLSKKNIEMTKYDGIGYEPVLEMPDYPVFSLGRLNPPKSFEWPMRNTRDVLSEVTFVCPDVRTSVVFLIEAFDLAGVGESAPYFRREMTILDRLLKNPGTRAECIPGLFDDEERMKIYPPIVGMMVDNMLEELELLDFVRIEDEKVFVTEKGRVRVNRFFDDITPIEREALKINKW